MRARRRDDVPPLRLPMAYCLGCVQRVRLGGNRIGLLLRETERADVNRPAHPVAPLRGARA